MRKLNPILIITIVSTVAAGPVIAASRNLNQVNVGVALAGSIRGNPGVRPPTGGKFIPGREPKGIGNPIKGLAAKLGGPDTVQSGDEQGGGGSIKVVDDPDQLIDNVKEGEKEGKRQDELRKAEEKKAEEKKAEEKKASEEQQAVEKKAAEAKAAADKKAAEVAEAAEKKQVDAAAKTKAEQRAETKEQPSGAGSNHKETPEHQTLEEKAVEKGLKALVKEAVKYVALKVAGEVAKKAAGPVVELLWPTTLHAPTFDTPQAPTFTQQPVQQKDDEPRIVIP